MKGDPLDNENTEFIRMFKEKYPKVYEFWGPMFEDSNSDARVLEITSRKLTTYTSAGKNSHLDILNVVTQTATRVGLEEMTQTDYDQF